METHLLITTDNVWNVNVEGNQHSIRKCEGLLDILIHHRQLGQQKNTPLAKNVKVHAL